MTQREELRWGLIKHLTHLLRSIDAMSPNFVIGAAKEYEAWIFGAESEEQKTPDVPDFDVPSQTPVFGEAFLPTRKIRAKASGSFVYQDTSDSYGCVYIKTKGSYEWVNDTPIKNIVYALPGSQSERTTLKEHEIELIYD